ncbi:hypothetical protein [Mucisphaera sp.]|uniref:hypothetical protein n=1 Tax=Mucisphaera sp. TaxID=2913024 RepID=UPI003D11C467
MFGTDPRHPETDAGVSVLDLALRLGSGDLAGGMRRLSVMLAAADCGKSEPRAELNPPIQAHGGAVRLVDRSIGSGSVRTEVNR